VVPAVSIAPPTSHPPAVVPAAALSAAVAGAPTDLGVVWWKTGDLGPAPPGGTDAGPSAPPPWAGGLGGPR
jgi:hypothetical protein